MDEERLALMEHTLEMILKFGVDEEPPIQSKFFTESVPELVRAYRTERAHVEALDKALGLFEAYHYKIEYDWNDEHMRAKAYLCRLCGGRANTVDLPPGGSVADAVAAIPHSECVVPSIRKIVGNPWVETNHTSPTP